MRGAAVLIAGLASLLAPHRCAARDFVPPDAEERLNAIGSTEKLDPVLRRAFDPGEDFRPIPKPAPSDWLAQHEENAQTYLDFVRAAPLRPKPPRTRIYLLPLGEFPAERSPDLAALVELLKLFFGLEAALLPEEKLEAMEPTTRKNSYSGNIQVLTTDVLNSLKVRLPADAYCLVAVTLTDLYPDPKWNFVFGQALLRGRVGLYSFARYDPLFYGKPRGPGYRKLINWRSAGVMAHEVGHMFGMEHCVFYTCIMNGSNHLAESDSRPIILCPVCLRKLQWSAGFDPVARYRGLLAWHRKMGFDEEATWIEKRLGKIQIQGGGPTTDGKTDPRERVRPVGSPKR